MKRSTATGKHTATFKVKKIKKKNSTTPAKKKAPTKGKSAVAPKKTIALKSKLTKQIETEVLKAYYTLWNASLSANMKTFSFYLADDFSIFGSANGEVFFSKLDAVKFYTATADETRGKAELRNRNISVQPLDTNSVIVREESDLYVLLGKEWRFYGHARISCVVKHINGGWKAVHQHASFPDHRTEEGQQLAAEKIEKENLELREAVKRRTIELESKNRELEIESSLERVRTVAMAMRKPEDMLQICESLYTELQKLGFSELRNSMINVYDDANTSFLNYDFSGEAGSSTTFFKNDSHPVIENFIKQVRKTRDAFAPVSLSGTKLRDFIRFRELNGEKTDIKLRKANAIHYYFYSIGNGSIGISTLTTIPDAQVQTLKRFRNVFEIAYQRYTDISLAEEQAREAQIELALERVRARTMAMQKSEELAAVSEVLRKEMGALGVEELETSSIYIVNENETTECWYAIKDVRGKNKRLVTDHMTLRLDETWVGRQMKKFFYSKDTRVSIVMKGENRKQWINYCAGKSSVLKGYYDGEIPARTYHLLKFSNGYMGAASPGEISAESWDLLQRATAVFSFAYKRFSDLQKAEAQIREAKIEAALERIRARALAMHRSDEFTEVAKVMREQMGYLGQPELETSAVHLYEEDADNIFSWRAFRLSSDLKSNITFGFFKIPKNSCSIAKRFVQKFRSKTTDYTIEVSGAEQTEWYKILFKLAPEVHEAMKKSGATKEKRYYHFSKFTGGALLMVTSKEPANDAIELQKRSAQVFDLAYRRFKDLQKAEFQARESQIQLALERVRARTMAMQNSNELPAAANLLFQQMQELGMPAWSAGYCIWDEDLAAVKANKQGITLWMSSEGVMQPSFHAPLTEDPSFIHMREAFERNQDFHVEEVGGKELVKHYKYMRTLPVVGKVLDSIIDAGHPLPVFQIFHCVYFSQGFLLFITYEPVPEAHDVFKRFGRVFDQTYTRFLDLQKAEAQAREAQIEAALERVRAASMAMHKSEELKKVASAVFRQLKELNIEMNTASILLLSEHNADLNVWIGMESDKDYSTTSIHVPEFDYYLFPEFNSEIKNRKPLITKSYTYEEKNKLWNYLFEYSDFKTIPDERKKFILDAESYTISVALLKNTGIQLIRYSSLPFSEKENETLQRFCKVFEQAYTRFLDLQKAEAQARDAQIEAAVERVRAQSMAMHNSEDVGKCIVKMFSELTALGVDEGTRFGIGILNHENENNQLWTARKNGDEVNLHIGNIDMASHPLLKSARQAWLKQVPFHKYVLEGEDLLNYYQMLNNAPDYKIQIPLEQLPEREIQHCFIFEHGFFYAFSPHEFQSELIHITKRFTSQFGQTYRRYLDLVRAEAQAREAQIEAALERVRSRSMAMHKSQELIQVVGGLDKEIQGLGIEINGSQIVTDFDNLEEGANSWVKVEGQDYLEKLHVPPLKHRIYDRVYEEYLKGVYFFTASYSKEEKNEFFKLLYNSTEFRSTPKERQDFVFSTPVWIRAVVISKNSILIFQRFFPKEFSEEEGDIFKRFGKVFDQAYTRFLDLQKAEAQAREAQIEAALERVRAKTMAMHKSEQLPETAQVLFEQFGLLGKTPDRMSIGVYNEELGVSEWWVTDQQGIQITHQFNAPLQEPTHAKMFTAWKEGKESVIIDLVGDELKEWVTFVRDVVKMPIDESRMKGRRVHHSAFFSQGQLLISAHEHMPLETVKLLVRFAKVFSQTYTRFLDLQKAEAQAREAQIEAALERVRSRSMAMHKSEEFPQVIQVVFEQFLLLDFKIDSAQFDVSFRETDDLNLWTAAPGQPYPTKLHIPYADYEVFNSIKKAKKAGHAFVSIQLTKEEKNDFFNYFFLHAPNIPEERKKFLLSSPGVVRSAVLLEKVSLAIQNYSGIPYSDAEHNILKRFAKAFEQTYVRFLDLQKAEAQAREAQIEAALERVRSRTMAMHKSDELLEVISVVSEQLLQLNFRFAHVSFASNELDQEYKFWASSIGMPNPMLFTVPYLDIHMMNTMREAQQNGVKFFTDILTKQENGQWHQHLLYHGGADLFPEEINAHAMSKGMARSVAINPNIILILANYASVPYSEDENRIIARFGQVFEQSYTRFLDLQKAEAQAREATIEAALEKVRGKAMAMHNSDDLIATAGVLFAEMRKLGINTFRCGVGLLTKESRKARLYSATTTNETDNLPMVGSALLDGHEVLTEMYDRWLRNEDYFPLMKGELLKAYYEKINSTFTVPTEQTEQYEQHGYFLPFSEGLFYGWAEKPYTEDEIKTLHRFKAIVDLTFRRYIELQKSEEIAREAVRSASLDRVRAEIASMRTKQDLERITPLIWKELTTLGIPFVRCGVFIMDEQEELIHTFLSTPDGKAIAAFHVPYGSTPLAGAIEFWREKKIFLTHWGKKEYAEFADSFIDKNETEKRTHYLSSVPSEGIHLHLLPFMQGMLYVGNTTSLTEDNLRLIQSVADAFSTAYARYEDFNKIESAKAQVEKTLTDLKQTQAQLVQSEKMASLGELTAGIAHEIQNPLNFVNNFSEVSNELIKEIQDIRHKTQDQGSKAEEDDLLKDIAGNLEKINHHGKRAADIVKGMLQHSRTSSVQKELTDINALADEYLRLAYHGLRAKDKSFNAKFETHLDPTLPKVNVVPQDIGRVFLNLINNAFYATSEKSKVESQKSGNNYEPTVTISTKKLGDKIQISVNDNGNGIPDSIKEKIFQPFFTTKPTGQGTGLGLSLSYDIVKAHGGELKVETTEGTGTTFTIILHS
jgi:signal transduction histidine kinase